MIGNLIYLLFGAPSGLLIVLLQFFLCKNTKHQALKLIPTYIFELAEFIGLLLAMEPVANLFGLDTFSGYLVMACGVGYGMLVGLGWLIWSIWKGKYDPNQ